MENSVNLETLEGWFLSSEEATHDARKEAERARDYVDGRQLTDDEVATLKRRGQPPVVINRIRRKISWLKGIEIKQRTDPKAFARSPQHEQGSESITDALRFVADNTDWDHKRSMVWDDMLVEGTGGVEVIHKQNRKGEVEVVINHYPWDRLFYDPFSRRADFSDARYLGAVVWLDKSDLLRSLPKSKARAIKGMIGNEGQTNETYDDRPQFSTWYDPTRERVRVVLIWHKHAGEWMFCQFTKGVKIASGQSPYRDAEDGSVCPLMLQSCYVGRENDRYGVVRDMIDPQDEINKRRSKALHALNTRQIIMTEGAVLDVNRVRREAARPDGIIEISNDPDVQFRIETNGELASGQAMLLQEAKNEIDMLGANSALAGETGESASGRAVLARQQGGMVEIAPEMDLLHQFTRRVYDAMWQRVRQFWTEERWVRVTDDERNVRFVGLNRPVTLGERLGQMPDQQAAQIAMQMALRPDDPRLFEVIDVENRVEEIDVDIVLEEVPDRVTLEGETFEAMLRYAQAGTIPPEVLIEADPTLPASKKERLLKLLQEQAQRGPDPKAAAEVAETEASALEKQAKAQKLMVEAQAPMAARF